MGAGGPDEEDNRWPPWLKPMMQETFFLQCKLHSDSHKSNTDSHKSNMYCLDCTDGALCSVCLAHHKDHRVIQIRRLLYRDVIKASEIEKYLDITSVQSYIINGSQAVYLHERPDPRPGEGYNCEVCKRGLVGSFRFCCLGCQMSGFAGHPQKSKFESSSPSTPPPPTAVSFRPPKRTRKGIPHRAPMG